MAEEKLQHSSGTLAIDLGSTTTVVAFQAGVGGEPIRLELPPITHRPGEVPSLLWMSSEQPLVGRQVLEAGLTDSKDLRLKRDFKRLIGTDSGGPDAEAAGEALLHSIWRRLPEQLDIRQGVPLIKGELKGPVLPANKNAEGSPGHVLHQPPTRPLLLNQNRLSRGADRAGPARH